MARSARELGEIPLARVREGLRERPPERIAGANAHAAVAAILRERPQRAHDALDVLFIRRAERSDDPWSGQMAFPGGRSEPVDADLDATARRETMEEIGLALDRHGELLGHLDDVPAFAHGRSTGMVVTPTVWVLHELPALKPNDEVAAIHWASLPEMMSGALDTTIDYRYQDHELRLPGYRVDDRVVWGLTHRMLTLLFERLRRG